MNQHLATTEFGELEIKRKKEKHYTQNIVLENEIDFFNTYIYAQQTTTAYGNVFFLNSWYESISNKRPCIVSHVVFVFMMWSEWSWFSKVSSSSHESNTAKSKRCCVELYASAWADSGDSMLI